MKKNKNIFLISLSILLILLICGGGIYMQIENHQREKMEMIKFAKNHKKEMDEEVCYGDKDHHIKSITYEWNTVEKNPMDGFMLNGYVNGDKNLYFGIQFDSDNGEIKPRMYRCKPIIASWEGMDK